MKDGSSAPSLSLQILHCDLRVEMLKGIYHGLQASQSPHLTHLVLLSRILYNTFYMSMFQMAH